MKSLEIVNENLEKGDIITIVTKDYHLITKEQLETIKKDLEVLEIIRKKKVEVFPLFFIIRTSEEENDEYILMKYNTRFNNKLYELTLEELLKLKQWLDVNE